MASAIFVILFKKNATIAEIKKQDSWRYNTVSPKSVGYSVLQNYFEWLQKNHYQSSKEHFLEWVSLPETMKSYYGRFYVFPSWISAR